MGKILVCSSFLEKDEKFDKVEHGQSQENDYTSH